MANLVYCPHCGYDLSLSIDKQRKEYESGVCRWCGFDKGFVEFPAEYDDEKLFGEKLTDYMISKRYEVRYVDRWRAVIEFLHIDENPYFDWDAALKAMRSVSAPSKPTEDPRKAEIKKQLMEKIYNQPHCPTCGSTNIKKLDVIDRAVSVGVFGIFSNKINKSFKCKNCGHTW